MNLRKVINIIITLQSESKLVQATANPKQNAHKGTLLTCRSTPCLACWAFCTGNAIQPPSACLWLATGTLDFVATLVDLQGFPFCTVVALNNDRNKIWTIWCCSILQALLTGWEWTGQTFFSATDAPWHIACIANVDSPWYTATIISFGSSITQGCSTSHAWDALFLTFAILVFSNDAAAARRLSRQILTVFANGIKMNLFFWKDIFLFLPFVFLKSICIYLCLECLFCSQCSLKVLLVLHVPFAPCLFSSFFLDSQRSWLIFVALFLLCKDPCLLFGFDLVLICLIGFLY